MVTIRVVRPGPEEGDGILKSNSVETVEQEVSCRGMQALRRLLFRAIADREVASNNKRDRRL